MSVFHRPAPALHARRAVAESARLTVFRLLERDGGAEVGAHLYLFVAREAVNPSGSILFTGRAQIDAVAGRQLLVHSAVS